MGRVNYIRSLLERLLSDNSLYDRDGCLNSDGRRLLGVLVGQVLEIAPWLRDSVYRVRRNPCFEEVSRFAEKLHEAGIIES